jgi:hypothetical protein
LALAAVLGRPGGRLAGKSTLDRQDRSGPAPQVRSRRRGDRAAQRPSRSDGSAVAWWPWV